eukprot:963989-Pyramimonas_sp.AAC.1
MKRVFTSGGMPSSHASAVRFPLCMFVSGDVLPMLIRSVTKTGRRGNRANARYPEPEVAYDFLFDLSNDPLPVCH